MTIVPFAASASDWELISPARPRRTLPRGASRSPKKKRTACAALCQGGVVCSFPPLDGVKWCLRHNEERIRLYTNYKAHGALLNAYPDVPACQDVTTIMACDSLSLLREWSVHLRGKYNLLTRCIEARVYFARKFFGEDMASAFACYGTENNDLQVQDFGHKTFWDGLVRQRSEVEQLMFKVETRGFQLILKHQNAQWVLDTGKHESGDCSSYGDLAHRTRTGTPSFRPSEIVDGTAIEDPLEAVIREKAIQLRERIKINLAQYCASSTSRFYGERLEVIDAFVRRAIYKDASLMFLSQSYDSVLNLLTDPDLDFKATEKMWQAISTWCIHDVRSAVDDVLRMTEGDHVVVLGGKVFKNMSGERWPLHAWGHMMTFRKCYSCLRSTCQTVDEIIDLTRYALLTRTPLSQSYLKYELSLEGTRELILAGFIPNEMPFSSPRHSIICKESGSCSARPVWEETQRNLSLYAGLSLSDPMAQTFVNACLRYPGFMVMLRKGEDARVIRSAPVIWTSRKRTAPSRSMLESVPWDKTQDVVGLSDSALEDAQPSVLDGKIAECMQVVIVDAGEGTMGDFVRKLVEIWCQVYRVDDKDALYDALKDPYEASGELDEYMEMTDEVTRDCYERLWGCEPPSGFALVEDRDWEFF